MKKIIGTNLGNWLVLEKWMSPSVFKGCDALDETWLNRRMDKKVLADRIRAHRDTYVTEKDFRFLAKHGFNMVRIPIPYFIFGDRPPFSGCIEYLDRAFDWAEKYHLEILVDLHTVPGGQNGYDNGGICGVCNWHKKPNEVEFALTVLERIAQRYAARNGFFGIEVLNEPVSLPVYLTSPTHNKYVDKKEAEGSGFVPINFLKKFFREAYRRIRVYLPDEKAIVFHDGFRLNSWNRFFRNNGMKHVLLDTHIYIFAMENFVPLHKPWAYAIYIGIVKWRIGRAQKEIQVIIGEWCICNRYALNSGKRIMTEEKANKVRRKRFLEIAQLEMNAWKDSAGWFYWNYQLYRNRLEPLDETWKESRDLRRCLKNGWMPERLDE